MTSSSSSGVRPDEHRDAIAEEGDEAVLPGPEGEGRRRQDVAALEARHVEAVAEQERARRDAQVRAIGDAGRGDGSRSWHAKLE